MSQVELGNFKAFLADKSLSTSKKNRLLRGYAKTLGMTGAGKKSGRKLIEHVVQGGGSWSSFTNWVKGAVNTVGNAAKTAGNAVYKHAIRPGATYAYDQLKNKPLSTIGKVAGLAGMIPSPFAPGLKTAGAALTTVGSAIGKGQGGRGRVAKNVYGKPLMSF